MARLNLEPFILPGMLAGGLVLFVIYKDELADIVSKIGDLIPGLGGNGNGDGDGTPPPTTGGATVTTNKDSYKKGETISVAGTGYKAGEKIRLNMSVHKGETVLSVGDRTVDSSGKFTGTLTANTVGEMWVNAYGKTSTKFAHKKILVTSTTGGGGNGGGTGGVATGTQWYKAKGSTTTLSKGRQDGESNRWNKNVTGWSDGFEVMGYLTVTGMGNGSHIGLKMAGPNHSGGCGYKVSGSCCCWWDGGLRRDGRSYLEIEYPHPSNKNIKYFKNMGRKIDDAGILGVRWLNMKEGSARRVMFWIDKSGHANGHKWELMYDVKDTGQFMPTSYYNKIPNEIELEIRISDVPASKIKWTTGPVGRKIATSSSNLAMAYDARTYYDRITLA